LEPAVLAPPFAGQGYDPGYLTTRPGTRQSLFYAPQTTDPAVVAEDEATQDVVSAAEIPDAVLASFGPLSALITAPVLLADGQDDRFFCSAVSGNCDSAAALEASEAPFFAASPCLDTYVLPGAGHDLNLATDTGEYQRAVISWADTFVGSAQGLVSEPPCRA
jgi:hypothetical protein